MPRFSETVLPRAGGGLVIRRVVEIELPAGTSLLDAESLMEEALQKTGARMVGEFLHAHDPALDALERKGLKWTRKLKPEPRVVESTFGAVTVSRWAYQTSSGGSCYYPLDEKMDLAGTATPKFAKSLAFKMANNPAATVCEDLEENHGRKVSVHFVQAVTDLIGAIALEVQPAPDTATLPPPEDVAIIAVGVDGTMVQITVPPPAPEEPAASPAPAAAAQEGTEAAPNPSPAQDLRRGRRLEWRNAMVGSITLYNIEGKRLGSLYTGAAPPEYSGDGKEEFWFLMERELAAIKARYPDACYDGISDGARDFVPWLTKHTSQLTLDFYHAAGYLSTVAGDMVEGGKGHAGRKKQWLDTACSQLKHDKGAAARLLEEMEQRCQYAESGALGDAAQARLEKSVTYYRHNVCRMDYAQRLEAKHPIASGVTESACGLIIKDRMCNRGMRWSLRTAQHIITLRSLIKTTGNAWRNFWKQHFNIPVSSDL